MNWYSLQFKGEPPQEPRPEMANRQTEDLTTQMQQANVSRPVLEVVSQLSDTARESLLSSHPHASWSTMSYIEDSDTDKDRVEDTPTSDSTLEGPGGPSSSHSPTATATGSSTGSSLTPGGQGQPRSYLPAAVEGPAPGGSASLLRPVEVALPPSESTGGKYITQIEPPGGKDSKTPDTTLAPNKDVNRTLPDFVHTTLHYPHFETIDSSYLQQLQSVAKKRVWSQGIDSSTSEPSLPFIQPEVDMQTFTTTLTSNSGAPSHATMFWQQPAITHTEMRTEMQTQQPALDAGRQLADIAKRKPVPPQTLPTKERILPIMRTPPSGILQRMDFSSPTPSRASTHSDTIDADELLHCTSILGPSSKERERERIYLPSQTIT